ncbi:hypothetical protein [Desulfobacterium sp. N47]|uniref:Uncharacterized protein n=1 Tax=uncultured Desulfobacterium sp. TaxID=201089 RepID=E1YA97_9BACT|nr:unknown protein [uncultured Desulfobacterium sp.]
MLSELEKDKLGSDKVLAETIVEELSNRMVGFGNKDNTIILVSESDTLYAGSLVESITDISFRSIRMFPVFFKKVTGK